MFNLNKPKTTEPDKLDEVIDALLARLKMLDPETPLYAAATNQLNQLYALKEKNTPKKLSKETLAIIAGNLAGILIIVGYEHAHVVTSKAVGFVMKAAR